jgi:hypothetical protein
MKSQVEIAHNLERVDPRFQRSLLTPEDCGAGTQRRNKFPWANRAGEFQELLRLCGKCCAAKKNVAATYKQKYSNPQSVARTTVTHHIKVFANNGHSIFGVVAKPRREDKPSAMTF